MEHIIFKTDGGRIDFGLGPDYFLERVSGINEGSTSKTATSYIDSDGVGIGEILYEPRMITVRGFISAGSKKELFSKRGRLVNILNGKEKGNLEYICDGGHFFTEAVLESLPEFGNIQQNVLPFIVYFTANEFYWKHIKQVKKEILHTGKKLIFPFTFPNAFGELITGASVINDGQVKTPCVITIRGTEQHQISGGIPGEDRNMGLKVVHETSGAQIDLDYDIEVDEVITIDTEIPAITSSINGNILHLLSDDSIFFELFKGVNRIVCTNYNTNRTVFATVEFYKRFVGV